MIYKAGGPLNCSRHYYIQRSEIEKCIEYLKNNPVSIHGSPRTGKSTLMNRLNHVFNSHHIVLEIQMARYQGLGTSVFFESLAREVHNKTGWEKDIPEIKDQLDLEEYLIRYLPKGDKLLFLLDDVERLPSECAMPLFGMIRAIYNASCSNTETAHSRIRFVLGFSEDKEEFFRDTNSPLYNVCVQVFLQDFSASEVLQLTNAGFRKNTQNIAATIYKWTDGHPYFTQCFLQSLSESSNKNTELDIDSLAEDILSNDLVLQTLEKVWNTDPPKYRGSICQVLDEKRTHVPFRKELEAHGVIKSVVIGEKDRLKIRNKIFQTCFERLRSVYKEEADGEKES